MEKNDNLIKPKKGRRGYYSLSLFPLFNTDAFSWNFLQRKLEFLWGKVRKSFYQLSERCEEQYIPLKRVCNRLYLFSSSFRCLLVNRLSIVVSVWVQVGESFYFLTIKRIYLDSISEASKEHRHMVRTCFLWLQKFSLIPVMQYWCFTTSHKQTPQLISTRT